MRTSTLTPQLPQTYFDMRRPVRGPLPRVLRSLRATSPSQKGPWSREFEASPDIHVDVFVAGSVGGLPLLGGVNTTGTYDDFKTFCDDRGNFVILLLFDNLVSQAVGAHEVFRGKKASPWYPSAQYFLALSPDKFVRVVGSRIGERDFATLFATYLESQEVKGWPLDRLEFEDRFIIDRAVSYVIGRAAIIKALQGSEPGEYSRFALLPTLAEVSFGSIPLARIGEAMRDPIAINLLIGLLEQKGYALADLCNPENTHAVVQTATEHFRVNFPYVFESMATVREDARRLFSHIEHVPDRNRTPMPPKPVFAALMPSVHGPLPPQLAAPAARQVSQTVSFEEFYVALKKMFRGSCQEILRAVFDSSGEKQRRCYMEDPTKISSIFDGRTGVALRQQGFSQEHVEFRL